MNKPTLFAVLFLAACASAGENSSPFQPGGGQTLQLIVVNQSLEVVTAVADWQSGGDVRLDEIPAGQTRSFTVAVMGQNLRVGFAPIGRRPQALTGYAQARPGDTFEWVLRSNGTVFYRRLS